MEPKTRAPGATFRTGLCPRAEAVALDEDPAALRRWLGDEERGELAAIASDKRRLDRLSGRVAAKRALLAVLADEGWEADALDLALGNTDDGLPRAFAAREGLPPLPRFSLSHSSWGGFAAASRGRVGVDLEEVVPRPRPVLAFAASPDELTPALLADPALQARLWTGKEAALKLLGLGLDADPRLVNVGKDGVVRLSGAPEAAWRALGAPPLAVEFVALEKALAAVARTAQEGSHG